MQQGFFVKPSVESEPEVERIDMTIHGRCLAENCDTIPQNISLVEMGSVLKDATTMLQCGPITGEDENLNLHRASSSSSNDESAIDVNSRHSSFDEPSLGNEGPEPVLHSMDTEPAGHCLQTALLDPCSPGAKPNASSQSSSTSGEECDPDEIYPHHKKFRMHRKRAAVLKASTQQHKSDIEMNNNELSSVDMKKCKISESLNSESALETVSIGQHSQNALSDSAMESCESTIDQLGHASASKESSPDTGLPTERSSSVCDGSGLNDVKYLYGVQSSIHDTFQSRAQNTINLEQGFSVVTNELHECRWLQCTRKFLQLDDLVNHVNDAHIRAERDIDYKCYWENCPRRGKGFNARYKMLIHVRTHTNERPYKCNLCSKCFSRLENLKIHNRSHTGERPYVCPFEGCNKAYSNSSDRFKHVRTHQEQKPYCCRMPGCEKRYTDPSSLRKHIKTHGHYFRPASEENRDQTPSKPEKRIDSSETTSAHGRSEILDSKFGSNDLLVANNSALANNPTYLSSYSQFANHPLLSHAGPVPLALNPDELRRLRVEEDFHHKALIEGGLLSALSLPRPPLLSLIVPFPVCETPRYALTPPSLHETSAHLQVTRKSSQNTHHLTPLGSTGSLSPGSHSPSSHGSPPPSDSEGSNSPFLFRARPMRSTFDAQVPTAQHPFSALSVSVPSGLHVPHSSGSPTHTLQSAFSPVSLSHCAADKYSFLSSRLALVNSPPRHSPTHHPYARPPSRGSPSSHGAYECRSLRDCPSSSPSHSPKLSALPYFFSHPRTERPLDLSNPSSPEMLSDREDSPRMSPTSPYHVVPSGIHMHCHSALKCDLGPAFPALHLLNHA